MKKEKTRNIIRTQKFQKKNVTNVVWRPWAMYISYIQSGTLLSPNQREKEKKNVKAIFVYDNDTFNHDSYDVTFRCGWLLWTPQRKNWSFH